jgi:hypothetical protein
MSDFSNSKQGEGYELPLRYGSIEAGSFPSRVTALHTIFPEEMQSKPETLQVMVHAVQKLIMKHKELGAPIQTVRTNIEPPRDSVDWFRREVEQFEIRNKSEEDFVWFSYLCYSPLPCAQD